jgi:hypothetical protein
MSQELDLFKIEPTFEYPKNYFETYIKSIKELLESILPKDFFNTFNSFYQILPFIYHSELKNDPPSCFSLIILCSAENNYGAEKFIADMISRWLIPGKQTIIDSQHSITFNFANLSKKPLLLIEYFINVTNENDILLIKKNLDSFIKEIKLILLAVNHAKNISSVTRPSRESTSSKANLIYILNQSQGTKTFDQMQEFLTNISSEKKLSEIRSNIAYLMNKKPKTFDKEIFDSVHNVSLIFRGNFTSLRDPKHVSRIISLQYLFKKNLLQVSEDSKTRLLYIKFLKTKLVSPNKKVLGILIMMNLLSENERLEKSHIIDSINSCIRHIEIVPNSYISDHRDDKILSFYLEIEKIDDDFSIEELKKLKIRLPQEIKTRLENTINPIFLPRNEEEVLRNIILLSKQLNYVKDIPQVIISYEKQIGKEISFTIILLRILKSDSIPLKELFTYSKTFLKFSHEEVKTVGLLKKKYAKEANIFRLSLNKAPFLRSDFSLDLQKARQAIASELAKVVGEFRDYNGGMISKQSKSLENLKGLFVNLEKKEELLLENFFYSIRPGIMQSTMNEKSLRVLFLMFLEGLKYDFTKHPFLIITNPSKKDYFLIAASPSTNKINDVISAINKIKIPSMDLLSSSLEMNEIKIIGFIYKSEDENNKNIFYNNILNALKKS